jgi:AcrR family transcriptional regulator
MTAKNDTLKRILNGTLQAAARHGVDRVSMRVVGQEAGVARGTLYRYFENKDQLLEAIGRHIENEMKADLIRAVDERPGLDTRLEVVVHAIAHYAATHPEAMQVMALESGFGSGFIQEAFLEFVPLVEQLLGPALERTSAVRSGAMSSAALSELILRVVATTYFVPTVDLDEIPHAIAALPCLDFAAPRG